MPHAVDTCAADVGLPGPEPAQRHTTHVPLPPGALPMTSARAVLAVADARTGRYGALHRTPVCPHG